MSSEKKQKSTASIIIEGIIIAIIMTFLAINAQPNFCKRDRKVYQKRCFSTQRCIMGAIEMYNMDHSEMINTYDQSIRDLLVKEKYLQASFMNDVECEFAAEGDLTGNGFIYCINHGEPSGKKKGKDEFASLNPKKESIRKRNKVLLILGLLFGPTLFYLLLRLL